MAGSPKLWMDAYLAAFAEMANLQIVTFDQGYKYKEWSNAQGDIWGPVAVSMDVQEYLRPGN